MASVFGLRLQLKRKAEAGPCDDVCVAVQATLAWEKKGSGPRAQRGPVAGATTKLRNRAKSHEQNDWTVMRDTRTTAEMGHIPGSVGRSVGMTDLPSEICVHETHLHFLAACSWTFLVREHQKPLSPRKI